MGADRYVGTMPPEGNTASGHTIEAHYGDDVRLLEHHVRHSPSGLSWGYGGSGPADLARSILWDYFGEEPHPACYQAFKFRFVALWPQQGDWSISRDEITAWLRHYDGWTTLAGYEARAEAVPDP